MVAPKKRLLHNKTLSFSSSTFIDIDLHIDDSLLASLGRCASERLLDVFANSYHTACLEIVAVVSDYLLKVWRVSVLGNGQPHKSDE